MILAIKNIAITVSSSPRALLLSDVDRYSVVNLLTVAPVVVLFFFSLDLVYHEVFPSSKCLLVDSIKVHDSTSYSNINMSGEIYF